MRALAYSPGSPFARAVRIVLHELELAFEPRELTAAPAERQGEAETPTLQVPVLLDGSLSLWESGTICEYLLAAYAGRQHAAPPLADGAYREESKWEDKLLLSTVQTFGTAATTISQLTWTGVTVRDNAHLQRCAQRMEHILAWLEVRLPKTGEGFMPGRLSLQDIFLACHIRFVQARPLDVDLALSRFANIERLLNGLDERASFQAHPIWWWDPGVTGYEADGTPVYR